MSRLRRRKVIDQPGRGNPPTNSETMKIETIEIAGLAGALTALRLPFGKEVRSEINIKTDPFIAINNITREKTNYLAWHGHINIHDKDLALMTTLVKRGDEHAKVVRGIMVWARIKAPVYFTRELETYRAGRERLSSSSTMHQECQGLSGEELQRAKAELPMGTEQDFVDVYSYQTLRRIVAQRHNHRLPEWHEFIDWVRTLPFAEELILVDLEDRRVIEEKAKRFDMIKDALENAESVNHFTELIKSMFTKEE